ncbi:MAG: TraV family lipoprotein [Gammaproteobacteria bacterium]|nr:TraV family lipoprotein [Gammaproteobacteria bacterium]
MTVENLSRLRLALAPAMAVAAALALCGCAATHVGEDWQCPLAQGTHCASVAAADPMVPLADARHLARGEPLAGIEPLAGGGPLAGSGNGLAARIEPRPPISATRARRHSASGRAMEDARDGRDCPVFCRPFGWFARVLRHGGDRSEASDASNSAHGPAESGDRAGGHPASSDGDEPPPEDGSVRLPETIGRVWIAPYVDPHGVYREASWVRIVIAPAAWKRPQ